MSTTKITNQTLAKVIKEEYKKLLSENAIQFLKYMRPALAKLGARAFPDAREVLIFLKGAEFKGVLENMLKNSDEFKGLLKQAGKRDLDSFLEATFTTASGVDNKLGIRIIEMLEQGGQISADTARAMKADPLLVGKVGNAAMPNLKAAAKSAGKFVKTGRATLGRGLDRTGLEGLDIGSQLGDIFPSSGKLAALGVGAVAAVGALGVLLKDEDTIQLAGAAINELPVDQQDSLSDLLPDGNMSIPDQIAAIENLLVNIDGSSPEAQQLQNLLAGLQSQLTNTSQTPAGTTGANTTGAAGGASTGAGGAKGRRVALAHKTINNAGGPAESVKQFQNRLIELGYSVGPLRADGDYGGGTIGGVKKFQEKNGLLNKQGQPDGIVGPNTWGKMSAEGAISASGAGAETADTGGGTTEDPAIAKIRALQNNPARAVRVYQYAYNQLNKETSNRETQKVLPRLGSDQGGYKLKGKVYSTDSKNLSAATMGLLAGLITNKTTASKALGIKPERIMQIVNNALNLPGNQKADKEDSGSTIDPSQLTGYTPPDVTGRDVLAPGGVQLQETKSYNLNFDKWSKLWK